MKLSLVAAFAFTSLMAVASPASASVTYQYDGQSFIGGLDNPNIDGSYSTSMEVDGSFSVNAPLLANWNLQNITGLVQAFSFNDGRGPITDANNDDAKTQFLVSTDASGNVTGWKFALFTQPALSAGQQLHTIQTTNSFDSVQIKQCSVDGCASFYTDTISTPFGKSGTWSTDISAVSPLSPSLPHGP